jgi:hypothetical protein
MKTSGNTFSTTNDVSIETILKLSQSQMIND